jgi:hypothetical protein
MSVGELKDKEGNTIKLCSFCECVVVSGVGCACRTKVSGAKMDVGEIKVSINGEVMLLNLIDINGGFETTTTVKDQVIKIEYKNLTKYNEWVKKNAPTESQGKRT